MIRQTHNTRLLAMVGALMGAAIPRADALVSEAAAHEERLRKHAPRGRGSRPYVPKTPVSELDHLRLHRAETRRALRAMRRKLS